MNSLIQYIHHEVWLSWNKERNYWHIRRPEQDINDYVYNRVRVDNEWWLARNYIDYGLFI